MPDVASGIMAGSALLSYGSASEADEFAGQQAGIAGIMEQIALEQWDAYKDIYLPTERASQEAVRRLLPKYEGFTEEKLEFDTEAIDRYRDQGYSMEDAIVAAAEAGIQDRQAAVTRQAAADVDSQYDIARRDEDLRQSRYGIEPSSGAARSREREYGIAQAGQRAAQVNRAREQEIQRQERAAIDYPAAALSALRRTTTPAGVPRGGNPITPSAPYAGLQGASGIYGSQAQQHGQAAGSLAQFALGPGPTETASRLPDFGFRHGGMVRPSYAMGGMVGRGTNFPPAGQSAYPGYEGSSPPVRPYPRFGIEHGYALGGYVQADNIPGQGGAGVSSPMYDEGGMVLGPGGTKTDSIPAEAMTPAGIEPTRLSTGEFVIPSEKVDAIMMKQIDKLAGIEGGPKK